MQSLYKMWLVSKLIFHSIDKIETRFFLAAVVCQHLIQMGWMKEEKDLSGTEGVTIDCEEEENCFNIIMHLKN